MANDFSKALWTSADILRNAGLSNYSELLTALTLLKFLNDNEGRAGSLTVPNEAKWNTLVFLAEINHSGFLENAVRSVEHHPDNSEIKGIFGSLDFSKLDKHPNVLTRLLIVLSQVDFKNLDWTEADSVLNAIVDLDRHHAGEFYTPTALSRLLVELANPLGGMIYDPACGTGGLLLQAYAYAERQGAENVALFGQELQTQNGLIAKMNALLHGVKNINIALGDTLTEPRFTANGAVEKFDYVLSNPPLALRLSETVVNKLKADPFDRFSIVPKSSSDALWLQHIVASLNTSGRAAVLVPYGVLFRGGPDSEVRKKLIADDHIEAIISLPKGALLSSNIPTAIILLNKKKPHKTKNQVLFVLAESLLVSRRPGEKPSEFKMDEEVFQTVVSAVRDYSETPRFSKLVSTRTLIEGESDLSPIKHIELVNRQSVLGGSVTWTTLEEIADQVTRGNRISKRTDEGGTPVIRGRDLSSPFIDLDELDRGDIRDAQREGVTAGAGDLLIQRMGQSPRAYVVDEELAGSLIDDTVYLIRLKEDYRSLAYFIADFLNSSLGSTLLASLTVSAATPTLNHQALRRFDIPIPERRVEQLVRDLHSIERKFLARVEKARDLRQRLFSIENAEEATQQLQALGVEAQALGNSLLQLDDLSFQIRNTYPYPLAYAYRTLDAIPDLRGRYQAQLRVAENFLAFLGSLGLALVLDLQKGEQLAPSNETFESYIKKLWSAGISPGDWQDLGRRSGKVLRGLNAHPLANSFADLWFKGKSKKESDFAKLTKRLVELKNDDKHDRGPKIDAQYLTGIRDLEEHLEQLYRGVAFLTQYPIRLIEDLDIDPFTRKAIIRTLVYVGDHPGLKQETLKLSKPLPKGRLYIEKSEGDWALLSPLMTVNTCGHCQARETYMIDSWSGDSKIRLKSFERGHTKESSGQGTDVDDEAQRVAENLLALIGSRNGRD